MDTSEAAMQDWRTWCRLCAKDDIHSNIDVFQVDEHESNLTANVEHLFGVCMRESEDLPHMLCTECYSLLTTLATFTERVARAQDMYRALRQRGGSTNLHAMRTKYGLLDEEREHLVLMQPITVVHCYDSKPKLQAAADVSKRHEARTGKNAANKTNVKLEECLLDVESEQLQSITVEVEAGEHEVTEDPFHSEETDCLLEVRSGLDDDDDGVSVCKEEDVGHVINDMQIVELVPLADRPQNGNRSARKPQRRRLKRSRNYMESETNDSDSDSELKPLKRIASDAAVAGAVTANPYPCSDCPRKFTRIQNYRQHMKRTHSKSAELPELRCEQCDRVFNTQYKLDRHVKTHLPNALKKVLICPYCEKKFSTNAMVQTHIKSVHMDERPFVCEECGVAVRTNASLKSHMLIHTDDKPFVCDVCNKAFKDHTRLKNHKEIHDPTKHICSECGLQLNSRSTLNRHLLVHSDVMKHKCDYCGRAFKRGKALKAHLILHTGLKPYSCDFCDRTFANGSNCRSHKKKAHPEELAALEAAGGGKTYTRNIPKLEVLKAVTKAADNLTPVVSKQSGRFAFGKKPKAKVIRNDKDKVIKRQKSTTEAPETGNSSSTNINATNNSTATTSIPTIDNIYSHILKHATSSDDAAKHSSSTNAQNERTNTHYYHEIQQNMEDSYL